MASPLPAKSSTNPYYVLLVLTLIFSLSFLDRVIFNVLLEPIRKEFNLSDTVMGLLSGFAFVIFYSTLSFPVSRWADRSNRRNIVSVGLVLWSAMTTLCGIVATPLQMAMARLFVGVGESTGTSPVHSLISDYFPKEKRTQAFGIFSGGLHLGVLFGYLIGGIVGQEYGWRNAFFVAGIPGLVMALLLFTTVKEPRRGGSERKSPTASALPALSIGQSLKALFSQRTYRMVVIGATLGAFVMYAMNTWEATFLRRLHHFDGKQIGYVGGLVKGICGLSGALVGGYLSQKMGERDERNVLRIPAYATIAAGFVLLIFLFAKSTTMAVFGLGLFTFLIAFHIGVTWGMAQTVSKVKMRAFAAAMLTICCNLIGYSLGSFTPGALSDVLKVTYGDEAIRYSLLTASFMAVAAGIVIWMASKTVVADALEATREEESMLVA